MKTVVPHLTKTSIPYADLAWPIVVGCSKEGRSGCLNCYACRLAATRLKHRPEYAGLARRMHHDSLDCATGKWCGPGDYYDWTGVVKFQDRLLDAPFHHRKPARVFVTQMGDLFHPLVTDAQIARVFSVMHITPKMTYVVLTKRHERAKAWLTGCSEYHGWMTHDGTAPGRLTDDTGIVVGSHKCWPLPNVHLVVSAWDQESVEATVRDLLDTPAAVRGLSLEPMLGPVDLTRIKLKAPRGNELDVLQSYESEYIGGGHRKHFPNSRPSLDWVIVGGETGPGARPMQPEWALDVSQQCKAAEVPFFWKQWGRNVEWGNPDDYELQAQLEMVATRELPEVAS